MSDLGVMRLAFRLVLSLHLLPAAAVAGELWISNHTDFPGRKVVMDLVGKTNFTYDAKGGSLTVHEPAIALHLKDCRNVTIRNLTIDWERPVLTEARIVEFKNGETRIRIDTSRYPVAVEEGRLLVVGPGRRERIRAVRFLNGRTGAPVPLTADTSFRETRAREDADGTIVLAADYSHEGTGLAVGDILVFRPFERPYPAVFIEDSSGVLLEDVIIRDAYGMGVIAQMSEDITWRGTGRAADKTSGVIAREGSHVTTHADASHFSNCRGQVTVENCWFEGMMDDAINVHSTCVQVTNVLSRSSVRCVFRHPEAIGFTLFRPGDRARFIRSRTNEDGPVLTVAAVRRVSDEVIELDFGTDLPADFGVGDTVENADYQCAATFRGNVVRNNRARGVLFTTPGKVICSSNRFERCCGSAVVLASDAAYWFESGHCRDVEIAGNVISNCLTAGYGRHGSAFGVISIDPIVRELDAQRDYCHSNIRIVDNEIFTFDATLLFARSAKDILWRNNVVRYNDDFKGWSRPPFVFERVTGFRNEPSGTGERLRLGVLSDLHIDFSNGIFLKNFEKALREYDRWGADAVLCCGDLTNLGYVDQLEAVAATWFRVFPENRRSDGSPVVPLFHYGDHDMNGPHYSSLPSERKRFASEEDRLKRIITKDSRKAIWERCFKEEWAPLMATEVKGYTFVRSHFTSGERGNEKGNNVPGLEKFLLALGLDPAKPFFYSQHRVPRRTAGGEFMWGQDDGTTTAVLSKYPNCFAFCGHAHDCCVNGRDIWQGSFTCLQVPSLRYCTTSVGRENGYGIDDRPPAFPFQTMPQFPSHYDQNNPMSGAHQGYFVEIGSDAITVRRWDFKHDLEMADPWRVPLPLLCERRYDHARMAKEDPVPSFPEGASISFRKVRAKDRGGNKRDFAAIEFPAARHPRANDYEVRLEMKKGPVERVLGERRVYSQAYMWGEEKEKEHPVRCLWPFDEIPTAHLVRFTVTPISSFGRRGRSVSTSYGTRSNRNE